MFVSADVFITAPPPKFEGFCKQEWVIFEKLVAGGPPLTFISQTSIVEMDNVPNVTRTLCGCCNSKRFRQGDSNRVADSAIGSVSDSSSYPWNVFQVIALGKSQPMSDEQVEV